MKSYSSRWILAPLALTLCVGVVDVAKAQVERPSRQQRREERQQRTENMTPQERQQYFQQRMQERMQNMTPEQRAAFQQRMQERNQQGQGGGPGGMGRQQQSPEDAQRRFLISAGVTDKAIQDAIIAFVAQREAARQPVLAIARELSAALADTTGPAEEQSTQQGLILERLQKAVEQYKLAYPQALAELDTKISYSSNPRLKSVLTLIGLLGDEADLAGGFVAIFPRGVAGPVTPPGASNMPGMPGMNPGAGNTPVSVPGG